MTAMAYQYVVLRCVPRVEREEFVNVGVVLYCQAADYLDALTAVDDSRLLALDPMIDLARVRAGLAFAQDVCVGRDRAGAIATQPPGSRFGFLKAPRSTVLQPGPVHGGVTDDPARCLGHLLERLVG